MSLARSFAMFPSSSIAFRASSLRLTSVRSSASILPTPRHRPLSTITALRYQRPQLDARLRNTRWNSSAAAASSSLPPTVPTPTVPTPPPTPDSDTFVPDLDMLTDTIAAIPPLQHGDLQALGLCHWTPAGLVQYSFELVHVFTGLPWFHTFVVAAFLWRVIIFPFAVLGTRHSARMRPIQTEMGRLQEQALAARRQGDTLNMQRLNVAAGKLRADAGVSMAALMAPMIQIPISIGMFFGIKRMCELPVIQLTQSGFDWIPDLTQPGPYYILPILVAASGNLMISMGARDLDPSRPVVGHVMNGFRIVSVLAIWWMNSFPSGLLLTLLVTSLGTVAQGAVFRMPAVRAALDIPQWTPPPADAPKLPTLRDTFREYVLGQRTQPGAQRPAVTPRVQAYVPPKAPRTLDVIAEQAQAHPSVNASSLYEEPIAPPPPKITPKKNKAARKAKSGRN